MSRGTDPPPPSTDFFGFGAMGVDPTSTDVSAAQIGGDINDMIPLFDDSVLDDLDASSMNIDALGSSLPHSFSALATSRDPPPPPALVPAAPLGQTQTFLPGDEASNAPGVGSMPATGLGRPPASTLQSGSTLTEFTKRRNWSAKVVEELKDLFQILDANGRIKYASPSLHALTGFESADVLDHFLQDFVHPDDHGVLTAELNESTATGNPLRLFYRLKRKDGTWAIFEAVGHAHIAPAKFAPTPNNRTPFCQAIFMMARPYPTKNAALLDSFLEHKIENERLKRRIAELRKEEADDAEESHKSWRHSRADARSDVTSSEGTIQTRPSRKSTVVADPSMPPPDRPSPSLNTALTRENLEGIAAAGRSDSIREKMARYEGATHADTIEMLTGLNYKEGERSRGITTGNRSPALIKGDVGIAIPVDRDPRTGEKKKKLKVAEEYVCTDCEWRKGPSGPKTLCNACGLRWAKKEKKKNNNSNTAPTSAPASVSASVSASGPGATGDHPS